MTMRLILWFIFAYILYFKGTNQAVLRSSYKNDRNPNQIFTKDRSNQTHCTWILYPPWKNHNDLFNDKPYNNSVEYFGISKENHINNESYIESSRIIVCHQVTITFYSKIDSPYNNVNLILFTFKQNVWNKEWEYRNNDSQWQLHQIKINIIDRNKEIQFRFLPISTSSYPISIAIAIVNISTHTNCQPSNQNNKPQSSSHSFIHPFLLVIFASAFLLIFITVMIIFIYRIVNKQYNQWIRKRSSRRRKKGRKTRNVVRDESTVIAGATAAV